jgi:hypothetical protein
LKEAALNRTMWRNGFRGGFDLSSDKILNELINPSGRTMALGLTQPLTEMSPKNISWGVKAAGV